MKKCLSLVLAMMLIVSMLPFKAYAMDDARELKSMALELFPEYAEYIAIDPSAVIQSTYSRGTPEVVVCETRNYDENTSITYTQLSDGVVVLSSEEVSPVITDNSSSGGSGGTSYNVTLTATCTISDQVFKAKNIVYTVASQGYDLINSSGSLTSSTTYYAGLSSANYSETSSTNPAYLKFKVTYYVPYDASPYSYYECYIRFYVGNNTRWTSWGYS